jgi:hypothetical protein
MPAQAGIHYNRGHDCFKYHITMDLGSEAGMTGARVMLDLTEASDRRYRDDERANQLKITVMPACAGMTYVFFEPAPKLSRPKDQQLNKPSTSPLSGVPQ